MQQLGEAWGRFSLGPAGTGPAGTSVSDFWPLGLWGSLSLWSEAPALWVCHCRPSKLIH